MALPVEYDPAATYPGCKWLLLNSRGGAYHILLDEPDYEWISQYAWHRDYSRSSIDPDGHNRTWSARRATRLSEGASRHTLVLIHRVILGLQDLYTGETLKPGFGDHINRRRWDNRRCNLRPATHSLSGMNRTKRRFNKNGKPTTSQYIGVSFFKEAARAQIRVNGKIIFLGSFPTELEAALAYDAAARQHHGKDATLNFP